MANYKIKKYYTERYSKNFVTIWATVFKYRFGFLVDINEEILDGNLKCPHENTQSMFFRAQCPKTKKEAKTMVRLLNERL